MSTVGGYLSSQNLITLLIVHASTFTNIYLKNSPATIDITTSQGFHSKIYRELEYLYNAVLSMLWLFSTQRSYFKHFHLKEN